MSFKIAYGAGHNNFTGNGIPKALDPNKTNEWVLNDRVARHFAAAAAQYEGVELLRVDDPKGRLPVSLWGRCNKANKWGADFCLSIHHNAGVNLGTGGGLVAFSYKDGTKSAEYRDAIYDACIAAGGIVGNRHDPTLAGNYYVLRNTNAPAVLMEYGFMDSKTDAPIIVQEEYSKRMAYATMEGIAKVAGLKRKGSQAKPQPDAALKSVAEIAKEVIAGKWGSGATRRQKLTAAGYDYEYVQEAVNAMLTGNKPAAAAKSVDEIAREVIAGKWYNGAARRSALTKAGYNYDEVQKRVNELLKG